MVSGLCEMRELTDIALPAGPGAPADTLYKEKKKRYTILSHSQSECTQKIPK